MGRKKIVPFTGTRIGGNPPDAGSAFYRGERIAWVPVDFINMSAEEFDLLVEAYATKCDVLNRDEVRRYITYHREDIASN